jgi:hypothetical protein
VIFQSRQTITSTHFNFFDFPKIGKVRDVTVTPQEGQVILKDIHAGVCGHHASSRAIAAKAFHIGFYWLTAIEDAKDIVRRCEACQ